MKEIHGILDRHNPYIGYFHYAPSILTKRQVVYFGEGVLSIAEYERRKRIRCHPYTGCFHFAPGNYSGLHGIRKFHNAQIVLNSFPLPNSNPNPPPNSSTTTISRGRREVVGGGGGGEVREEVAAYCQPNLIKLYPSSYPSHYPHTRKATTRDDLELEIRFKSKINKILRSQDMMNLGSLNLDIGGGINDEWFLRDAAEAVATFLNTSSTTNGNGIGKKFPNDKGKSSRHHLHLHVATTENQSPNKEPSPPSTSTSASSSGSGNGRGSFTNHGSIGTSSSILTTTTAKSPPREYNNPIGSWQTLTSHPPNPNHQHHPHRSRGTSDQTFKVHPFSQQQLGNSSSSFSSSSTHLGNSIVLGDNYLLEFDKFLGEGSYAKVYRGTSLHTREHVAIKIIKKSQLGTSLEQEFVSREMENHCRLKHPNIVNCREIFESPAYVYVIMDYCSCGNLGEMLAIRKKFSEEEVKCVAYQLLLAIHYMHDAGVMHADIKPPNILFMWKKSKNEDNDFDLLYEKRKRESKFIITLPEFENVCEGSEGDGEERMRIVVDMMDAIRNPTGIISFDSPNSTTPTASRGEELGRSWRDLGMIEKLSSLYPKLPFPNKRKGNSTPNSSSTMRKSSSVMRLPSQEHPPGTVTRAGGSHSFEAEDILSPHAGNNDNARRESNYDDDYDTSYSPTLLSNGYGSGSCRIKYKCPYGLTLCLCDFGQSQKIPDIKHFQYTRDIRKAPYVGAFGTPGYLAPELVNQQPYGLPSDMWAIGVVIYECLAGQLPFPRGIPSTTTSTNGNGSGSGSLLSFNGYVWKNISSDAKDLINGLLQIDENARFTAKQCLAHRWFADLALILRPGTGTGDHGKK